MRSMHFLGRVATVAFATFFITTTSEISASDPTMIRIEDGSYPIGSAEGAASAQPPHSVSLDPFLIDALEVTNAHPKKFTSRL